MDNKFTTFFKIFFSALLIFVIAIFAVKFYQSKNTDNRQDLPILSTPAPHYKLLQENKSYAEAENLLRNERKYSEAVEMYNKSLETVTDEQARGQINYKIGTAEVENHNFAKAISKFKEIAANGNYSPVIRASAVEYMGRMYYTFNDKTITQEIFKDFPYKDLLVMESVHTTYKNLFAHASNIYPLGISESRIANWHSYEIIRLTKEGKISNAYKISTYKKIVKEKLDSADKDIERVKKFDTTNTTYINSIMARKADTLANLNLSEDFSLGEADKYYDEVIKLAEENKDMANEPFLRLNKAIFLSKVGKSKDQEVIVALKPLYTDKKFLDSKLISYIKNSKKGTTFDDLVRLASIDSEFALFTKNIGFNQNNQQ